MPPELKEKIKASADETGRSMNAEIVHRLTESINGNPAEGLSGGLSPEQAAAWIAKADELLDAMESEKGAAYLSRGQDETDAA